jgi:hypothetical protein
LKGGGFVFIFFVLFLLFLGDNVLCIDSFLRTLGIGAEKFALV